MSPPPMSPERSACTVFPKKSPCRSSWTYLKGKLGDRIPNLKGDLLVIRADFAINRNDFNIQKGQSEDKVSPTINLTLSIAGASAQ